MGYGGLRGKFLFCGWKKKKVMKKTLNMNKRFFTALICVLLTVLAISTNAQTVTLAFTGKKNGSNQYVRLTKVVITNLTRNWTETIYYPDTILQLSCGVGIEDFETEEGFALSQNIPNPFAGQTDFVLRMVEADNVHVSVYDINGKKITGLDLQLSKGIHSFRIMLSTPQAYMLKVHTKKNSGTVKILNTGDAGENRIEYLGETNYPITYQLETGKGNSSKPFMLGDLMQYVGFSNYYGTECHSQTVTQAQTSSELFTLKFSCDNQLPVVNISPVTSITHNSAVCGGEVISEGTGNVIDRGVCWNTDLAPTTYPFCTHDGTGSGSFTSQITGLSPGTLYYVRAYARNNVSIAYSSDEYNPAPAFYTLPYVVTDDIPDILPTSTTTSVTLHGQVQYSTSVSMISKGFCWSTSPNPTTNDNQVSASGAGSNISATVTGLTRGVTYYVRAYAQINGNPLVYGNEVSFVAVDYPVVTTNNISNITTTSATCGGNVTSDGGVSVTARGVYYSTSSNFGGSYFVTTNGSGTGSFTSSLTNLIPNTTYYVKAYATNIAGTRFGDVKSFRTEANALTVTTNLVENIGSTSAKCGGTINTGAAVTDRGICWSTTQNPTLNNDYVSCGSGTGSFTGSISALTPNTTYYVRAYATNSDGTVYGNEVSATTSLGPCPGMPTVTDIDGNIYNTVQIGNQCWMKEDLRVTKYSDGLPLSAGDNQTSNYQGYYYCYSAATLYNWVATTRNTFSSASDPFGVKGICPDGWHVPNDAEWNILIEHVSSQSQYYCSTDSNYIAKALAGCSDSWYSNSTSCAVGNEPQYNNRTGFSAGNYHIVCYANNGFSHGEAKYWSATQSNTTNAYVYSFSSYSPIVNHNSCSKSWGCGVRCIHNVDSISYPTVVTSPVSMTSATSVTCGGNVTDNGNDMVAAKGLCWSTLPNPNILGSHSIDGSDTGSFTRNITGLSPNTTYYIRAYATNSVVGTSYGNQVTFTTPFLCGTSTVTDYDGNTYNTTEIGNQCWMKENLRSTHYPDGVSILSGSNTLNTTIGYFYTPNSNANISTYGYLYNWKAAIRTSSSSSANPSGVQGICPNGWHLPSNNEWTQLSNYTKCQSQYVCDNSNIYIAKALASKTGWSSSTITCAIGNNPNTNNATGFSALPAGNYGHIHDLFGMYAEFWSSTESNANYAKTYLLYYDNASANLSSDGKQYGMSVRCLRDFQFLVATNLVTNITGTTAICGGTVYYNGDSTVTNRGVCWSTSQNPTLSDNHTVDGSGSGSFISHITDLIPSTIYYIRAYAINGTDTVYGDPLCFVTLYAALPIVITGSVESVSLSSAICGGNVTSDGDETVTTRGVCWSTSPNPNTSDNYTSDGNGTGGFSSLLSGLTPNTTYYVRAYATNGVGTAYGEQQSFTTLASVACPNAPSVTDYDGNTYNTVQIGNQCWMKENLKTTHYSDGTEIPLSTTIYPYGDTITPLRYYPNNLSSNLTAYGYWYNWEAVMKNAPSSNNNPSGRQGICPVGWHVPSKAEWEELINYVSSQFLYLCDSNNNYIAKSLSDTIRWLVNNNVCAVGNTLNDNNSTGFSALPSGFGGSNGIATGKATTFATSTRYINTYYNPPIVDHPYYFYISYDRAYVEINHYRYAYSVRCLRSESDGNTTPSVMSDTVSNITDTTAMCGGDVITDGNAPVITRGVCWNTLQNPKVSDSHTSDGTGTGSFTSILSGLNPGTTYYVRAYATNNKGVAYGEQRSFTTSTESVSLPIVITDTISNVVALVATCGGVVLSDGGAPVTARGVCWRTSPNPTVNDNYTVDSSGTGSFTSNLIALMPDSTYHVRAYATNCIGTAYGNEIVFTVRQFCPDAPTVSDYDGNIYNTVQIGSQCWMKENLRTTHYANGTSISSNNYSNHSSSNIVLTQRGYHYNWSAVMNGDSSSNANPSGVQGICPIGWHVPSDTEWSLLTDYVSSLNQCVCGNNNNNIAKALATSTIWSFASNNCNVGRDMSSNNTTGFSAIPTGYLSGSFYDEYKTATFWSSTENNVNSDFAWFRSIFHNSSVVFRNNANKSRMRSVRCMKNVSSINMPPMVITNALSNITNTTAICGGNVSSDGGSAVIARGVCWNTTQNPTVSGDHTVDSSGTGNFTSTITGLTSGTTYYVRAYATNSVGTAYGSQVEFSTALETGSDGQPCSNANTVTDYDGNVYNTVQLGNQCWMRENLKTTHYSDGTLISLGSSTSSSTAYLYYPNNVANNVSTFGYLYNWKAVMRNSTSSNTNPSGVQGICPVGWHVPSIVEWTQLVDYVGGQNQYVCGDAPSKIAKALASTTSWDYYDSPCSVGYDPTTNNATGFSVVPAGSFGSYESYFGSQGSLWSSTGTYYLLLDSGWSTVCFYDGSSYIGHSVRCIRDQIN